MYVYVCMYVTPTGMKALDMSGKICMGKSYVGCAVLNIRRFNK